MLYVRVIRLQQQDWSLEEKNNVFQYRIFTEKRRRCGSGEGSRRGSLVL